MDVLSGMETIKICTGYIDKNTKHPVEFTTNVNEIKNIEPVYETMDGWMCNISNAFSIEDLPENAQKYIQRLTELLQVPIEIISVGCDRSQTIDIT